MDQEPILSLPDTDHYNFTAVEAVGVYLNNYGGITIEQPDTSGGETQLVFISSPQRLKEVVAALLQLSLKATWKDQEGGEEA